MEEWKEYKLGDICTKIGSGATPKGGKEVYLGGNYSVKGRARHIPFITSPLLARMQHQ